MKQMNPAEAKAPYSYVCKVRQNLDVNAIFKDSDSVQPDVVSGVVSVRPESPGNLEVVFAEPFLDVFPSVEPLLPQLGVAHNGVEVDKE